MDSSYALLQASRQERTGFLELSDHPEVIEVVVEAPSVVRVGGRLS
jgi:hypothetical protein